MLVQFNLTDGTTTYINVDYIYQIKSNSSGQTDLYLDLSATETVIRVFGDMDTVASKINWKW